MREEKKEHVIVSSPSVPACRPSVLKCVGVDHIRRVTRILLATFCTSNGSAYLEIGRHRPCLFSLHQLRALPCPLPLHNTNEAEAQTSIRAYPNHLAAGFSEMRQCFVLGFLKVSISRTKNQQTSFLSGRPKVMGPDFNGPRGNGITVAFFSCITSPVPPSLPAAAVGPLVISHLTSHWGQVICRLLQTTAQHPTALHYTQVGLRKAEGDRELSCARRACRILGYNPRRN